MPSLLRFLLMVAVLAGLAGAAVVALATFVEPQTREMIINLPRERFEQPR